MTSEAKLPFHQQADFPFYVRWTKVIAPIVTVGGGVWALNAILFGSSWNDAGPSPVVVGAIAFAVALVGSFWGDEKSRASALFVAGGALLVMTLVVLWVASTKWLAILWAPPGLILMLLAVSTNRFFGSTRTT